MSTTSSTFSNLISHPKSQLALTALASGLIVGGSILGYQHSKRRIRTRLLKDSIPNSPISDSGTDKWPTDLAEWSAHASHELSLDFHPKNSKPSSKPITDEQSIALAKKAQDLTRQNKQIPEALILEQLSRNHSFLGSEGLQNVRNAFIIVVGLGGVGSWCTTMLVRSGVGRIRLIDFDQVTLSSLNRHAVATLEDVGTPKVECMKKHLSKVAPWVEIETCNEMWKMTAAEHLMTGSPVMVVDAIDNIETKVDLLTYCHTNSIPVISSMGAACKSDPTRICVADISETLEDPLSKQTRRKLRARGIATGITAIFSTEKPGPGKAQLLPLNDDEFEKGSVDQLGIMPDFRARILPVLGTMPATFGLTIANHVMCTIAKYPVTYTPQHARFRPKLYDGMLAQLVGSETRIRGSKYTGLKVPFSEGDIGYMVEEVFKGKSVISGVTTKLQLVRWLPLKNGDESEGVGIGGAIKIGMLDVAVVTADERSEHEKRVLKGGEMVEEVWGQEVVERVQMLWEEERKVAGLYR